MINLLLSSASKYKIKDEEKIKIIKNIQEEANNIIKEIKKAKSLEELNNLKNNSDKVKIDLNEYFIQREMKLKNKIGDESEDDSKNAENNKTENTNVKNKEINKSKSHRRKKYKRKEDEYENDFVEDESGAGSEEESERIDLSNHVIDLGKKKSGNNIKRIADELQEEAKNYISMRSRRNINKKKDNDFIYDDIYGKKNDSVNSRDNSNSNINSEDDNNKYRKRNAEIDYDDEDYIEEENKIKERKHKNKAYDDNILNRKTRRTRSSNNPVNESKNTHIDNKKVNNNAHTNIVALNSNEENKIKSRKNALANITKILTDNKYLMEEGMDFVNALANRVEEDLAKAFPAIDFDYQKTLSNMNKKYLNIKE